MREREREERERERVVPHYEEENHTHTSWLATACKGRLTKVLGIAGPSWTVSRELNGNSGPFSCTTSNSIGTTEPAKGGGARTVKLARRHTARENLLISGSRAGSMNNLRPERSGGEDPGCADSVGHDCPSLKETRKLSTSRAMEPAPQSASHRNKL